MWAWFRNQRRMALVGRNQRQVLNGAISRECLFGDHVDCPSHLVEQIVKRYRCVCPCHSGGVLRA